MSGRPTTQPLYGLGYLGRTPEEVVAILRSAGVGTVVDVRLHPVSRKRGFSKGPLRGTLEAAGIDYVHEPGLGNPPENRPAFRRKDLFAGRERMRSHLAGPGAAALEALVERANATSVALLCLETSPDRCHRQVILEMAARLDPRIEAVHLS